MATNYIKVRPYVAKKMGVENQRCTYPDGNFQLWANDLTKVDPGWVFRVPETVARIGGFMMDPYRNREEHDRSAEECVSLPVATDPEWIDPEEESEKVSELLEEMELEVEKLTAGEAIEEIEEEILEEEEGGEE